MPPDIGIAQPGDDGVAAFIQRAAHLLWHRLPLAGGLLKADIAVGGHAAGVHQDADAALMAFGVKVVKRHYINAVVLKITLAGIQKKAVLICHGHALPV